MSIDDTQAEDTSEAGESFTDLVDAMNEVDTTTPDATENETTISDNNGGRIELGEDMSDDNIIRKK